MNSLYIQIEDDWIGLANKGPSYGTNEISDERMMISCIKENLPSCIGSQGIYKPLRICVEPQCNFAKFLKLDNSICKFTTTFNIIFITLLFGIIFTIIFYFCMRERERWVFNTTVPSVRFRSRYT